MKLVQYKGFLLLFLIVAFHQLLFAQQNNPDPLNKTPTLIESSELILVWSERLSDGSGYRFGQKIYDYNDANPTPPNQLITGIRGNEQGAISNSQVAAATGDFNDDGKTDFVSAYVNTQNKVRMVIPQINPQNFGWAQVNSILSQGTINSGNEISKRIRIATGNFDSDRQSEYVLAFIDNNNKIKLELYDTDGTLVPNYRGGISDESSHTTHMRFSITTADFNGDGKSEIIITGVDPVGGGGGLWGIFVKVYEVSGTGQLTLLPKAKQVIFTQPQFSISSLNLSLAKGDFNNDIRPDIALSFSFFTQLMSENDSYLYLLEVSENLNTITFNNSRRVVRNAVGENQMSKNDLAAGDLNGDGKDELFWGIDGNVFIYEPDTSMVPQYRTEIGGIFTGDTDNLLTNNYIGILDVDRDFKDDLAIVESFYTADPNSNQYFRLRVYGITGNNISGIFLKAQRTSEENIQINGGTSEYRSYALGLGDFNGDRVRLGAPNRYQITDILQPMVILNAPPIHFDIINGVIYDLNACYNGNNCDFYSRYEKVSSQSVEVKSEVHRDWGVSASLSGGGNFLGLGVKASMTASYGEKFQKVSNSSQTVTVGIQVTASEDDYIYATVADYDVWEYPVFTDSGYQGNLLVLYPLLKENRWFPAKSWSGSAYKPNHEVSNILSYYAYTDSLEQNEDLAVRIKGSLNESFVLNGSSNIDWFQTFTEFQQNQSLASRRVGLEVGASVSGWGIEVGVNGNYSQEEISTHTTSVTEQISLKVHLDNINMGLGEVSYLVTPYSYWAKNGALVIDYAVRPEISNPGGTQTWWQVNYQSKSDPAFILPWRYDPEKGFTLQDPNKRYQTKEITFQPMDNHPGDTVTVKARIHNYSLIPTPGSVKVKFYIGDPDSGGTLITSLNGQSEFFTTGIIPARGKQEVQMQWAIPQSLPLFSRIYAVIDPDNQIDELHTNNNKGWAILGRTLPTSVEDEPILTVSNYELYQNFPNPFNPATRIVYSIPTYGKVTIKVFDVLGQELSTLINDIQSAGRHEIEFNTSGLNLTSGVYFYQIKVINQQNQATEFLSTKKMLLLK
ncbi:MAG: T9SS type A sorting domain-containing protein [Ignavibacterium album]|uniref:FG-GAP repeat domain-containing protein n=1 Tax=Ignavibacterium album TaxID=591197 RepID=UPI0026E9662A|nr:T9SS type A sorting domain-containing protein [Ignavibacterium album]MCX8106436.1 T9SS type A sorting domain-containing protein [Ignavibacterium album]